MRPCNRGQFYMLTESDGEVFAETFYADMGLTHSDGFVCVKTSSAREAREMAGSHERRTLAWGRYYFSGNDELLDLVRRALTSRHRVGADSAGPSNNTGKIEGTKWSSQAFTLKGKSNPSGALALEFATDGRFTYAVKGDRTFAGRYILGPGDEVSLDLDEPLEGRKRHRQRIVITDQTMQFIDSDGTSIPFRKVR